MEKMVVLDYRAATDDVLVAISLSRDVKVLRKILGIEIKGAYVTDGLRAYSAFKALQRC
ncbi:MAG: hypothetical protein SVJ22_11690 [Halobacteriota archaeon]|nr:hypothetical protein [Halobacteriota archaeon]